MFSSRLCGFSSSTLDVLMMFDGRGVLQNIKKKKNTSESCVACFYSHVIPIDLI